MKKKIITRTLSAFLLISGVLYSTYAEAQLITTYAGFPGNGNTAFSGDGGPADSAVIGYPMGLALDSSGNLYIVDNENFRIRKVTKSTGIINTIAGTGYPGCCEDGGSSGDGGPADSAEFSTMYGIAVDHSGNIYVDDAGNNRVRRIDAVTGIITTLAVNVGSGGGIAVDDSGNVYVNDNFTIKKINPTTGIMTSVAGNGIQPGSGAWPADSASIWPSYLAVDHAGNIYFTSENYNQVLKVDAITGGISLIAGDTTIEGFSGDGGPADSAHLSMPQPIALDSAGNIYFGDYENQRVRKINISTGIISTVAGNGVNGDSGDGGAADSAGVPYPIGLVIDPSGNIFISASNQFGDVREVNVHIPVCTPSVTISAITDTVCANAPVTFTATAINGGPSPTFQWDLNLQLLPPDTGYSYTVSSIIDGSHPNCFLTSNAACAHPATVQSNFLTMWTKPVVPPSITITGDSIFCAGSTAVFTPSVSNGGISISTEWLVNGVNTGIGTFTFSDALLHTGDMVSCQVTSNESCASIITAVSNVITIHALANATPAINIYGDSVFCAGTMANFKAIVTNGGDSSIYQWEINSTNVGANTDMFSYAGLNNGDTVSCFFTSHPSCADTATAISNAIIVAVNHPATQPLCLVTSDTDNIENIVIWEKADKYATDSFFISRTNTPDTTYQQIAAIPRDSLSEYDDISAHPAQMSYRYKMNIKDTCGHYSILSNYHQTIYLQYLGSGNFEWTPYVIENDTSPVTAYDFYRDSLGNGNWQLLASLPNTQTTASDPDFSLYPNARYKVVVTLSSPCTPTRSIITITSNVLTHAGALSIADIAQGKISLQPNPAHDKFEVINSNPQDNLKSLTVFDQLGNKLSAPYSISGVGQISVDIRALAAGLYYVEVNYDNSHAVAKVVKF